MQEIIYPSAIYPKGTAAYLMPMDEFETRKRRLNALIADKFNGNRSRFCEASGEDPTYISRIYSRNPDQAKPFSETIARRIERKLGLPKGWLDQDDSEEFPPRVTTRLSTAESDAPGVSSDEYVLIEELTNELGAGNGAILKDFDEVAGHHAYRRAWIAKHGYAVGLLRIVTVKGNSMVPYVFHGNKVLINTADKRVVDGEHYAIRIDDEPMIKQLFRQGDGKIRVQSYNAPEFFIAPGKDAEVLGIVVDRKGA